MRQLGGHEEPILLVHATGFHARVWDQMIRHLEHTHFLPMEAPELVARYVLGQINDAGMFEQS